MKFWDSSALIPLLIEGPQTSLMRKIIGRDKDIVAWWGTPVECSSAFARLRREGFIGDDEENRLRDLMDMLSESWIEVEPTKQVKDTARKLLLIHPLKSADALQLAAACVWAGNPTRDYHFVCLDKKLRRAAKKEGFEVLPREIP